MSRKYRIDIVGQDGNLYFCTNYVYMKNALAKVNMHRAKGNAVRIANRFTGKIMYLNPTIAPHLPA